MMKMPEQIDRRDFLALCAAGALPGLLAACQGSSASANATPTAQSTRLPSPTPGRADWSELARSLQGTLVLPGSPQYSTALQLFDPRFDAVQPAAIAYCASPADVQAALAFARRFNLLFTPRAGGHSYAGYSTTTGLVLDVTRMSAVTVNGETGTATIGAGARLIDVYAALAQHNLALPAGSCPSVGIAGQTLGGGIGVLGRKFGLTSDNLLAAQVVVADGRVLTCDANHDPDLFWALRGGGGGNFGVVTSLTFQAHPVTSLSLFSLSWPWTASNAADVVEAWQAWAPQAPDELWSNCLLLATSDKRSDPVVHVGGVYVGDVAPLNSLVQQLTSRIGVAPASRYAWSSGLLDAMLYEAGCKNLGACHLPSQDPQGQLQRVAYGAKSDYFITPLSRQGINILVSEITRRQATATLGEGGIGLDAQGGAINRVAADATAFVHRDALFSAQYTANWNASDPATIVATNRAWLTDIWQQMRPYASGFAYQNYIDPDLSDWQHAYYGANLARLQRVKAAYDPKNLFHFAQSIPPVPGA